MYVYLVCDCLYTLYLRFWSRKHFVLKVCKIIWLFIPLKYFCLSPTWIISTETTVHLIVRWAWFTNSDGLRWVGVQILGLQPKAKNCESNKTFYQKATLAFIWIVFKYCSCWEFEGRYANLGKASGLIRAVSDKGH